MVSILECNVVMITLLIIGSSYLTIVIQDSSLTVSQLSISLSMMHLDVVVLHQRMPDSS